MRFLYVLVSICLFVALLYIPVSILFDENNDNIDANRQNFKIIIKNFGICEWC